MGTTVETCYDVLGVTRDASSAQIKAAYRKLIAEVHPDKLVNASPTVQKLAEERAKDINEAHRILSSSELRREYDSQLDSFLSSQAASQPAGSQTGQESNRATGYHQSQYNQPEANPSTSQHVQHSNPNRSVSPVVRTFFAIYCVVVGSWVTQMMYSTRPDQWAGYPFLIAFGTYGLAAWASWPLLSRILSRLGIAGTLKRTGFVSVCILLFLGFIASISATRPSSQYSSSDSTSASFTSKPVVKMPRLTGDDKDQAATSAVSSQSQDKADYGPDKEGTMTGKVDSVFMYPDFELKKYSIKCADSSQCWFYVSFAPKGQTDWSLSWYGNKPNLNVGDCAEMHVRIATGRWETPEQDQKHLPKLLSYRVIPSQTCSDSSVQ